MTWPLVLGPQSLAIDDLAPNLKRDSWEILDRGPDPSPTLDPNPPLLAEALLEEPHELAQVQHLGPQHPT